MSTIAARAHSNATLAAPVRRAPQPRRAAAASPLKRIARMVWRRPGRAVLLLLFSGVAIAILANAMLFQKARHPAPIISAPATSASQRQAERRHETPPVAPQSAALPAATASPTSAPLPPSRANELFPGAREAAAPRPPAAVTSIPRTAPAAAAPAPARAAAARDPIADLINGSDFRPPAEIKGVAAAKPATPRRTAEN